MNYQCTVCGQVSHELLSYVSHTETHIVELLKHDHPEWVEGDGVCKKCLDYYHAELKGSVFKDAACVLRQRKVKGVWRDIAGVFSREK
jgi:hypothetical protein